MEQKYFLCKHCGNVVTFVKDAGAPVMCCGEFMAEIIPGTVEASVEKHLPIFTIDSNKVFVMVGEVEHPATAEHHIEWISIKTKQGSQIKYINATEKPIACFSLCDNDEVESVFAYCNLHGLWKADNVIVPVCDLKPVDTESNENYLVCKCNNVTYFDIVKAVHGESDIKNLLSAFDKVKNTTHCSTGCGGCYNKVVAIISEEMNK